MTKFQNEKLNETLGNAMQRESINLNDSTLTVAHLNLNSFCNKFELRCFNNFRNQN